MPVVCQSCGIESRLDVGYERVRRSFRRARLAYCPPCSVARAKRRVSWQWGWLALFAALVAATGGWGAGGHFAMGAVVSLLLMVPTVVVHEFAHACVARGLGLFVSRIQIGTGATRWRGSLLGFDVEIKTVPFSGFTLVAAMETRHVRAKMFAMTLAGPLANAALAVLGALVLERLTPGSGGAFAARIFIGVNGICAILNLLPLRLKTLLGKSWTDGGRLLTLPFWKTAQVEELHGAYFALNAIRHREMGDFAAARRWIEQGLQVQPRNPALSVLRGMILLDFGCFDGARALFQKMIADESNKPETRAVLLNNVAWADFMLDRADLLEEADRCSLEALEMAGWSPAFMGTRASVLIALGRTDEGMPLAERSLAGRTDNPSKALIACCLALGSIDKRDTDGARRFLATAAQLDPRCLLLHRVRARLEPAKQEVDDALHLPQVERRRVYLPRRRLEGARESAFA